MLDWNRFEAMTFDCYGTLIDWESGLLAALRPLAARAERPVRDATLLERYAVHEAIHEGGQGSAFKRYRDVQRAVLAGLRDELGFEVRPGEEDALAASIRNWPAFADTASAMRRLKQKYKLCVCSNIDRDLFEGSRPKLGVELDGLVTAEDVRSYKPAPGHFERVSAVLGVERSRILHVAQSLYHDVKPARAMGYSTVWVNRQKGRWGATLPVGSDVRADVEVGSLEELAGMIA